MLRINNGHLRQNCCVYVIKVSGAKNKIVNSFKLLGGWEVTAQDS